MPYIIRHYPQSKTPWWLINTETGKVKGRHKTRKLAKSQMRLLQGIEHGWKPTKIK